MENVLMYQRCAATFFLLFLLKIFTMKKLLKTYSSHLEVHGKKIPLKIAQEIRTDARVSMGRTAIHLRLPAHLPATALDTYLDWAKKWAEEQFDKHDRLKTQYVGKIYHNGDILRVGNQEYVLNIVFETRKSHHAKIRENVISLSLAFGDTDANLQKSIKLLISRMVASRNLSIITSRVLELNDLHFQKPIRGVHLKHNESNWGSCSNTGNVNLSTRLLFAPQAVQDYVIIHELAHLIELNHSERFWKLVSDVMPSYEEKEKWLKENGKNCNF
jgi:predicted metal-dependent hydrolase